MEDTEKDLASSSLSKYLRDPDRSHERPVRSTQDVTAAREKASVVLSSSEDTTANKEEGVYSSYIKLWRYATPIDVVLRICGFLAACGAGAALPLMTIIFGRLVNVYNGWGSGGIAPSELLSAVSSNALVFLYLFLGKFFLVYIHTSCFTITATRATRSLREAYIRSLIRQDLSYFDSCSPGSVATSISTNADMVQNGLSEKVGIAFQGLSMLTAAFIVAFTQQWKLTLVTAVTLPAAVIGVGITIALDARLEAKILDILAKAGGLAEEALGSIRIVTAFGANAKLQRKYDEYLDAAKKFGVKKGPILGIQYSTEFFMMYCAYSLAFYYGIKLLLKGEIGSGGSVITVLFAVTIGTSSITMIAPSIGEFAKAAAAAKKILAVVDQEPTIDSLSLEGEKPEHVKGGISLQNVSFAYPARPSIQVLQNVSLDFEAGKVTAIVGASGSGKSTIVGLIERWYDPQEGSLHLDGHDIKGLNVKWLRSQIGYVQQEPFLFNDTIYNNIVHGLFGTEMDQLPEAEKRQLVQAACVEANADTFIRQLPDGYDTVVGERGGLVSGGQKQRIAIARSIISNPHILLLDEATSALDPKAEGIVQAALDRVSQSRTTIMIAHKLSTVKKADKIIVMKQGCVIEQGTHSSLLNMDGAYAALVKAQNLLAKDDNSPEPENEKRDESMTEDITRQKSASLYQIKDPAETIQAEDVSRKLSLVRCIAIIFREQKHLWPYFLCGFIACIAGGGVFPAQAVIFSRVVTVFQLPPTLLQEKGNFWALIFFILAIGVLISYATLGMFLTVTAFISSKFYRSEYFGAMLRQDISYFDLEGNSSGSLTSKLSTDPQRLQDLISANLGLIVIVIVNLVGSCTLALAVGWKLGLVAIFGCIPFLFFAGFMRMRLEASSQDRNSKPYQESARFAAEAIGAIRTVSSLTMESKVLSGYTDRLNISVRKSYKHVLVSMALFGLSESLDLAASGLAFWYGGKLLSEGEFDVQTFFMVFVAIIFGGQAAGVFFGFTMNTTKAHAAANQIIHLRNERPPINTSTGKDPTSAQGDFEIEFDDVRFSYPTRSNVPILRGLSLKIQRGQSVGIVGASGCGKTTVISLLERFYDVEAKSLRIRGQPLSSLDVHAYRAMIGLVSQDTVIYQGSIRENVILGTSDDVSEEQVTKACKDANIHDFILSLPEGYDTDAGSRGLALSGGQRQRIAIARALIRDPQILLFDEATSALDTQSESIVQSALETAAKGRTAVAVAHRLSTVRNSDCIFVLDAGRVIEQGTHEELIALKGKYWDMVLAQSLDREAPVVIE